MRIDAHQHFWSIDRGDYGWLTPESGVLWRDYLPDDLAPLLAAGGIDRTILVQAAPTEAETDFLLNLAAATPFVAGVVGWTEFAAPDAPERIARLGQDRMLVGLRPMVQDIPDDEWLLRPALEPAFAALEAQDLVFDALVLPRHLRPLERIAARHQGLRIVLDHAAKPQIAHGALAFWREDIERLAAHPNVVCKVSGLVTEAGERWRLDDLRPVVDHLLNMFGPTRLLFGSDWPVCTLRTSYAEWLAAAGALTSGLAPDDVLPVFGPNAERIYLARRGRL